MQRKLKKQRKDKPGQIKLSGCTPKCQYCGKTLCDVCLGEGCEVCNYVDHWWICPEASTDQTQAMNDVY